MQTTAALALVNSETFPTHRLTISTRISISLLLQAISFQIRQRRRHQTIIIITTATATFLILVAAALTAVTRQAHA